MNLQDRFVRMIYHPHHHVILASDVKGRIHMLDLELNLIRSSPSTSMSKPLNGLTATDTHIFTKDRLGSIAKWDVKTLRPVNVYDPFFLRDESDLLEGEEPSPAANRGISVLNGRVYANNGYGQFVVLDADTFDILEIRPPFSENSVIDCVGADSPDIQAVSDIHGVIHIGRLETNDFPVTVQADNGGIHWVRYDFRHHRFLCTQDNGLGDDRYIRNGFATFETDGSNLKTYAFTSDDVEFLEFDSTYEKIYVGGFDGCIYVYDNTVRDDIRLLRRIGPFPYQIINLVYVSDDQLYVLMQTGEIVCVNARGDVLHRADFHHQCVWALEPHPMDDSLVYAALDDGIQRVRYGAGPFGSVSLQVLDKHPHHFGISTRVKPLPDGSYVATGRKGFVFRSTADGRILWYKRTDGITRNLAVDPERGRLMVGTDEHVAVEYDLETGNERERFTFKGPVYVVGYLLDGRRLVALKTADIFVYAADSRELLNGDLRFDFFPKRFLIQDGKYFLVGGFGLAELDLEQYAVKRVWVDYLINTKENAALLDGHVHIVTYGYQLGSYRYDDGEIVSLHETMQDFAKAITGRIDEEGRALLLVGGRGGFLNAYQVQDGVPMKSREVYL